jgi:hypothetical protein
MIIWEIAVGQLFNEHVQSHLISQQEEYHDIRASRGASAYTKNQLSQYQVSISAQSQWEGRTLLMPIVIMSSGEHDHGTLETPRLDYVTPSG